MEPKKFFSGKLEKNKAMALSWIPFIGWIFGAVIFIIDLAVLSREEKRELLSVFICAVLQFIPVVILVLQIIALVKALKGESFKIPLIYDVASMIIK